MLKRVNWSLYVFLNKILLRYILLPFSILSSDYFEIKYQIPGISNDGDCKVGYRVLVGSMDEWSVGGLRWSGLLVGWLFA